MPCYANKISGVQHSRVYFLLLSIALFFFFPLLLCWVAVHCSIYKGYYLQCISYITPSTTSLYPTLPKFIEQLQWMSFLHLHSCIHIFCTIFNLLPSFPATFPFPLVPTTLPPPQDMFYPPVL
jgi:hypothetical protein